MENIAFTGSNVLLVGEGHPFETIQDAIDAAGAGDTILVADGDYGPITIDKSLTLLAIGDEVTITGADAGDLGHGQGAAIRVEIGVDDVTIGGPANGFDVVNGVGSLAAIFVAGDNEGVLIEGIEAFGGTGSALLTGGKIADITVRDNEFFGDGTTAIVYNNGEASRGADEASSSFRFIDNTITGGDDAGLLLGVEADDAVITGNTFEGENADFGLLEIFGEGATITGNTFEGEGFVPAIRDSFDNYDDDALVAANTFSGSAITVLSPGAAVSIDADALGNDVEELDVSSLSAAAVTFTSLGNLTQIETTNGQTVELDGSQIAAAFPDANPLATDQTLTIVGGAAVNIVNAGLTLPNDGTAPTVNNLLALEFEGLADENSLVPENLTIDGSHASVFAAFWIHLDASYVATEDSYFNLAINTDFVRLGNDYVRYLNAGGEALLDLVKVSDTRLQTLHDNLLGNLGDGPINSRFINLTNEGQPDPQPDPRTEAAQEFGDRPYHSGTVSDGEYTSADLASATVGWDLAHGITYPADLPAPYGVLDGANTLNGSANGDYFFGGGGNDTIDGGDGDDTATYRGDRSDFEIVATEDGGFTLTDTNPADGDEGSDTLTDVENIQFGDGTLHFGATLARAVPEDGDGNDGFHPGSGNSDVNFAIHDNTEVRIEAAIKTKLRYQGDTESDGLTYYTETGISSGSAGLWNFDYSVVDYGAADLSNYTIAITADFTDINGNTSEGILNFDPIQHRIDRADVGANEFYYQDPSGDTDGVQNSQNLGWQASSYDASAPGSYDFVLTVRDGDGNIVAQTEMRVEVAANIIVDANGGGDHTTIQAAIDAANEGDTILVLAGDYNETVTIDKQVTLLGAQTGVDPTAATRGDEAVLTGAIILQDGADGTKIEGFTIAEGTNIGGENASVYLANGAADVAIENNVFMRSGPVDNDTFRGILGTSNGANTGLTITQNTFSGWHTGVFLNPGATDAAVTGNIFNGNFVGMSVDGPDATLIAGNTFTNNDFEGLGIGPGEAQPALTLNGNAFADNGGAPDGRSIGVYDNGITVTSDDAGTNTVLELQGGVTDITLAGSAGLSVIGNGDANDVEANAGDNLLDGGDGADTIDGGDGDDTLLGGLGNDDLAGDGGADLLYGGADNDVLYGDAGEDTLYGGSGNDEAEGGIGNDVLFGDEGSDTLDGGDGNDTIIGGIGDDDLAGDAGADLLNGGQGNDTLFGDAGADTLIGGAGADSLVGGAGGDTFVYEVLLDAGDVIDGFSSADGDRIDLDALLDSLDLADDEVERATRVEIQQNASGEDATISIDSNGDATFDTVVATVTNVTGDLNNDSLILNVS